MYIPLKPLFSRHNGIGVQFTDEPTGNLDSRTSQEVLGLLKLTGEQFHQTIVMITHNDAMAQLADRVIRIEDGKITGGQSTPEAYAPRERMQRGARHEK
nr:hypothetical protein [uncultured Marvinbryantia sp.]